MESIAKGGMAEVFRATDVESGRVVALKRLNLKNDPASHALFQREYHVLSQIHHPRVIEVYDYGTDDNGHYYAMELLDGEDLRQSAPLDAATVCQVLRDVASSLALLHARRLVHRDVSAGNVRRTPDGHYKLLDFGAMATFGVPDEIVGTAPYVPPEALRGDALDQRADLYGLGALAYFLLTGRHAYPARRLSELSDCWTTPPCAPSELVPDVPPAVDELVLCLLSIETESRPVAAADVIHRLDAIAGIPPDEDERVATSYLSTPALVGRESQLAAVAGLFQSTKEGVGGALLIDASAGGGRSRLVAEAMLIASVRGFIVVRADGAAGRGSYGAVRALGLALLRALGDEGRSGADDHDRILSHLIPELMPPSERASLEALPDDASETRARVQRALLGWFRTIARDRPLLVAVDNLERVDEASCSFLAVLADAAANSRLAVVCTVQTGSRAAAPAAIAMVRRSSRLTSLEPLRADETASLLRSLFGDVPNLLGLASLVHPVTFGNPLACMTVARHLVAARTVLYERGAWCIPLRIGVADLPASLGEIFAGMVARLSPAARRIANLLSLARSDLELGALSALEQSGTLFPAIGELLEREIVVVSGDRYRIAQDPLRDLLNASLDDASKRELHLALGHALEVAGTESPAQLMDAGWHFYFGGEEVRGAEMLERAAEELAHVGDPLFGSVAALEAALRVYERDGRSLEACLRIRTSLVNASYYVDRALAARYGEETIGLLLDCTGLSNAKRFSRVLGARRGVVAAVALQALRRRVTIESRRGPRVREAMSMLFRCGQATTAVATYCLDRAAVRALVERLSVLGGLPDDHPGRLFFDHFRRLQGLVEGREGEAYRLNLSIIARAQDPALYPTLSPAIRRRLEAGMLFSAGILESFRGDRKALGRAEQLTKMEFSYFHNLVAEQLQMLCYAHRGELVRAHEHRARYELLAVQAGAAWQAQVWTPAAMALAYLNCGDMVELKRCLDQLDALADEIHSLVLYRRMLQVGYLMLQRHFDEAIHCAEDVMKDVLPRSHIGWSRVYACYAEALNETGRHDRARDVALAALEFVEAEDRQFPALYLALEEQLAIAEAGLGRGEAAAMRADALIREYEAFDNLCVRGNLEGTRATIAIVAKDAAVFRHHHANMERLFKATGNQTLVDRSTRLGQRATRVGLVGMVWTVNPNAEPAFTSATNLAKAAMTELTGLVRPEIRVKRALTLLMDSARASWGLLYLLDGGAPRLVARSAGAVAPEGLVERLSSLIADIDEEDGNTELIATGASLAVEQDASPEVLVVLGSGDTGLVGVAVLKDGARPHPELITAIATALAGASDTLDCRLPG